MFFQSRRRDQAALDAKARNPDLSTDPLVDDDVRRLLRQAEDDVATVARQDPGRMAAHQAFQVAIAEATAARGRLNRIRQETAPVIAAGVAARTLEGELAAHRRRAAGRADLRIEDAVGEDRVATEAAEAAQVRYRQVVEALLPRLEITARPAVTQAHEYVASLNARRDHFGRNRVAVLPDDLVDRIVRQALTPVIGDVLAVILPQPHEQRTAGGPGG